MYSALKRGIAEEEKIIQNSIRFKLEAKVLLPDYERFFLLRPKQLFRKVFGAFASLLSLQL